MAYMTREQWVEFADQQPKQRDRELMVRAYDVIMGNMTQPDGGHLWSPNRCIVPALGCFNGVWNWDCAFHVMGVSRWDPQIARENVIGFTNFQKRDGMFPDAVTISRKILDDITKPPVLPWATEIAYKEEKDINFLKTVYPRYKLNEEFWVNCRSKDGMFYYIPDFVDDNGNAKNSCESGWDNSVRWDMGAQNIWAIDLNCYMVMFYRSMAYFAEELSLPEDVAKWNAKEKALIENIEKYCWDEARGCYADVDIITKKHSSVISPASFMPLFIGIAPIERAEAMRAIAEDKNKFDCKMPTVAYDDPEYSVNYWRGPTWINVAYFAAKGLKNYGFEVGDKIKEHILDMIYQNKEGIYDTYNSLTGVGNGPCNFSWSSAFTIEFIINF